MHAFYLVLSMQGLVTQVMVYPALATSLNVTAFSCSRSYSLGEGDLGVFFCPPEKWFFLVCCHLLCHFLQFLPKWIEPFLSYL